MWAPRFGQCLTFLLHLLLSDIVLFVAVTDMTTTVLVPTFWFAARKAQNTSIQIHLPNSHPLHYTLQTHGLLSEHGKHLLSSSEGMRHIPLLLPFSHLQRKTVWNQNYEVFFSKVSKALTLGILPEHTQAPEKGLGGSSILCCQEGY